MRRLSMIILLLALAVPAAAQEGNPCQAALTTVQPDPNLLAFHIADLDKLGVTTVEFIVVLANSDEPQERVKIPRALLRDTAFPLCYTVSYAPAAHLTRDGKTQYFIVARTEDASMRVSAWSARSNPFVLGTVPAPLPLPVPGVRVGRTEE